LPVFNYTQSLFVEDVGDAIYEEISLIDVRKKEKFSQPMIEWGKLFVMNGV
jgi:hypothetical protein